MSGIPREKIDQVQAAADIVEVAADYVGRLKQRGSGYVALCPFHDEKTPSFSISPEKNLFYCFGCQEGGDIFKFVQEMEGVSFPEAARMLADRFGVSLPQQQGGEEAAERKESVYHALRFAARFFYRQLAKEDSGRPALDYLQEERELHPDTIKRFGLGYAPDRWDGLLQAAQDEHLDADVLERAGLVIARDNGDGHYDRYRGRIIFPILSHVGRVLGFAGRLLKPDDDDDYDQPKYINSPETKVYHKKRVLYGLSQAKKAIRESGEAMIVEGYTDVIALHQAGLDHAVATCGTALTNQQVRLLSRYADRLVLLYDADEAGGRAAARGLELVLAEGMPAYAVSLPEGSDPDSYVREEGSEAFSRYVRTRRQDVAAFHRARAERAEGYEASEARTEVMRKVVAAIARIPDGIMRENQLREAADVLDMYEEPLRDEMERLREQQQKKSARRRRAPRPTPPEDAGSGQAGPKEDSGEAERTGEAPRILPQEKNLLRLLLEQGRPMVELILGNMALNEFTDGPARELAGCFLKMYEAGEVEPRRIVEGAFGPAMQQLAASIMVDEHEPSENWGRRRDITVPRLNENAREAAISSMTLLKRERVGEEMARVKAQQYQNADDEKEQRRLQEKLIRLQELRRQIERREFVEWNE